MSSVKQSKRLHIWSLGCIVFIAVCGFSIWGIRELLFPATDACALERSKGKNLLDLSQVYPIKENIELIGHVGGKAKSVFVRGDIAFVKLGLELAAFDIQNPVEPKRIGYILIPGELVNVDDKRHYAYIHSSGDSSGLWKIDISDPAQMSAVHVYHPQHYITDIRLLGEQAYITTQKCEYISFFEGSIQTRCDDTLHIVDTANPDSLISCYQGLLSKAVRTFAALNAPELVIAPKVAREGDYIYFAEGKDGLKVYDISNPIKKIEVGLYSPSYEFTDVITYGSYAFATSAEYQDADQKTRYALHLLDVGAFADPKDLGELPYKPVIVTEFKHYAILREQFGIDNWPLGVEVLDLSLPKPEGVILTPKQIADIVNMTVIDNRAYATTRDNSFLILDISKVENPIAIASHSLGRHDQLNYGVSVAGNYAYIIVRDMGMRILDISDESNIIEVGDYRMDSIPVELTVKDHYAYIAEWYGNLEIVDVSDPTRPTQASVYNAEDRINEMHIVNNHLFMTTGSSGLQVIDISEPTSPYQLVLLLLALL